MPDKLKTTEPMILAENLEITDEREAEIERLRTIIGDLLAAAKDMLSAIATRDIPSFVWGSPRAEALKAAIEKAEEP